MDVWGLLGWNIEFLIGWRLLVVEGLEPFLLTGLSLVRQIAATTASASPVLQFRLFWMD